VPVLTANIFAAATNRTNKMKQGRQARPLNRLPNLRCPFSAAILAYLEFQKFQSKNMKDGKVNIAVT
jgi:hypothetical protein